MPGLARKMAVLQLALLGLLPPVLAGKGSRRGGRRISRGAGGPPEQPEPAAAAAAPAAETPAAETPAAETPAAETPAAETPAAAPEAPGQMAALQLDAGAGQCRTMLLSCLVGCVVGRQLSLGLGLRPRPLFSTSPAPAPPAPSLFPGSDELMGRDTVYTRLGNAARALWSADDQDCKITEVDSTINGSRCWELSGGEGTVKTCCFPEKEAFCPGSRAGCWELSAADNAQGPPDPRMPPQPEVTAYGDESQGHQAVGVEGGRAENTSSAGAEEDPVVENLDQWWRSGVQDMDITEGGRAENTSSAGEEEDPVVENLDQWWQSGVQDMDITEGGRAENTSSAGAEEDPVVQDMDMPYPSLWTPYPVL